MNKGLFILTVILIASLPARADYDARVTIHQNTLNGFLKAIGSISNVGKTNIMGMDTKYTWVVKNPRIIIDEDKSLFISDVAVEMGIFNYSTEARGDVLVNYDETLNHIKVNISKVTFELYFKLLGNKIHISDVDISGFYHPSFEFSGPEPLQSDFSLKMPDGRERRIYIKNVKNSIHTEKEQIIVDSNLQFSDMPFSPPTLPTGNITTANIK